MNSFHQVGVAGQRLQGRGRISLQQVPDIDLLRFQIGALQPREGLLQVAPYPLNRVQLGAIGWQPDVPHILRPLNPLGGVRAAVIQEQDVEAVGKCLGCMFLNFGA